MLFLLLKICYCEDSVPCGYGAFMLEGRKQIPASLDTSSSHLLDRIKALSILATIDNLYLLTVSLTLASTV